MKGLTKELNETGGNKKSTAKNNAKIKQITLFTSTTFCNNGTPQIIKLSLFTIYFRFFLFGLPFIHSNTLAVLVENRLRADFHP